MFVSNDGIRMIDRLGMAVSVINGTIVTPSPLPPNYVEPSGQSDQEDFVRELLRSKAKECDAPWMSSADADFGIAEDPDNNKTNPAIDAYFDCLDKSAASYMRKGGEATKKNPNPDKGDNLSWCACFCGSHLQRSNLNTPSGINGIRAFGYSDWECPCKLDQLKFGAIVVFEFSHVGMVVGETDTDVVVLGGNQDDKVQFKKYPKSQIKSIRYPCDRKGCPAIKFTTTETDAMPTKGSTT